jgi:protein SCO1
VKKIWIYLIFFVLLIGGFLFFVFSDYDFSKSKLAVINPAVPAFQFTDQNGKTISQNTTDDKVYVAEYFFTTCKGICPKMNANMRRVYNEYKDVQDFLILSHTCMPETDSVPVLKVYERKMINGRLVRKDDGSYKIEEPQDTTAIVNNTNWHFLTGDKGSLYAMARQGYMIDNGKPDSLQKIQDQFIHTQFFALVDKNRRVRAIYDGLKNDEVEKLLTDIKDLLKEKATTKRFMNGFSNNPN